MKNTGLKKGIFLVCFLFAIGTMSLHAQGLGGPPGFEDDVNDEAPQAPIDGFIGLALAAGAYFGGRELKKRKK